jgi:hypothetical protein
VEEVSQNARHGEIFENPPRRFPTAPLRFFKTLLLQNIRYGYVNEGQASCLPFVRGWQAGCLPYISGISQRWEAKELLLL